MSLPDQALAYKYVKFENGMANTGRLPGSSFLSANFLKSWRPNLPAGWFYLGQAYQKINVFGGLLSLPSGDSTSGAPYSVIVQELEDGALSPVKSWEKVWDDAGDGVNGVAYSLWRGIPESDDYVVIGGIFKEGDDFNPPDDDATRGIRAVRKDLLISVMPEHVWTDTKSGADKDGSVWTQAAPVGKTGWDMKSFRDQLNTGVFTHASYVAETDHLVYPFSLIPAPGYQPPANDRIWVLDATKVLKVD